MAQQKLEALIVGKGNMLSSTGSTTVIAGSNQIDFYSSVVAYDAENIVEYSGKIYRSLTNTNTNNQPDISPTDWEVYLTSVQDGMLAVAVAGINSDLRMRINGAWTSAIGQPQSASLVDGQATPVVAFEYSAIALPYAMIEYTVRRGSGQGRKRKGTLVILNDGSAVVNESHETTDIGSDVFVDFSYQVSAGMVQILYTSGSPAGTVEGVAVEVKYSIKGWA